MKKYMIELGIILVLSVAIGLVYNHTQATPMPLFSKYEPMPVTETGEDLSAYYDEIDADTLQGLMDADMVVVLDARIAEKYDSGHIPGAVSLPIVDFQQKYDSVAPLLQENKSIVVYCIGVHCVDSAMLAKQLHDNGHREIFVYKGGIEEWLQLGYPVE